MNVMEYIVAEQKRQEMTNAEFAERLPFSRQRYEEILKQADCRFLIVRTMLKALGKDIEVRNADGSMPDFDTRKFVDGLDGVNTSYAKVKAIVESAGQAFFIIEGGASDGAPLNEERRI